MATTLLSELPNPTFGIYYDQEFMTMIEYHLPILRTDPSTEEHPVDTNKRMVYEGDLYGYLSNIGVPAHFHWITLRLNKLHSSTEFINQEVIYIPGTEKIENLMNKFRTKNRRL